MSKETIQVPSISCGHCKASIEGALSQLDGVTAVAVDVESKNVDVEFDPAKVAVAALVTAIEDQGHEVAGR